MRILICAFLFATLFPSIGSAIAKTSSVQSVLSHVAPATLKVELVPKDFQFNPPKHKRRTLTFWRGDLNKDGAEDLIICAINKISEVDYDGYLVFATFENGDWKLKQIQKFPGASGPSLKDFSADGYLIFFESLTGNPPLKVVWSSTEKKYELQDTDSKAMEK